EAAAKRERQRLEAEAAEAAAKREQERQKAAAAAKRQRELEVEAAARRDRERLEADAAAKRERERLEEEEAAADQARVAAEAERGAAEAARSRERHRLAAAGADVEYELDLDSDAFSDFRPDAEERRGSLLQLIPLSDWAKVDGAKSKSKASSSDSELHDLIDGLDLPTEVAAVTYGGGCRIRRVRVPAPRTAPRGRTTGASRPVILSKRALDEARSETRTRH
ncbi:MAG: hypothetical protein ACJ74H_19890, partial [Thermoanaerobaculia bacterium]